jgi:hypothetical protein
MSRNITILALIQLLVVILGFFALGIILKVGGYPQDPGFPASLSRVVWSPFAIFFRHYGLAFLFVPAVWTVVTSLSQSRRIIFSFTVWSIIGIVLPVVIISLFIYACIHRYAVVPN